VDLSYDRLLMMMYGMLRRSVPFIVPHLTVIFVTGCLQIYIRTVKRPYQANIKNYYKDSNFFSGSDNKTETRKP
jgi:hypothetical protein